MSKLLIGIHGRPHSGKDTAANYLVDKYGFSKFGPSFPVKATAAAMFDVDIDCFYNPEIKETIDPFWGISYREMAQKIGKESSRDVFFEDIWMRHVEKRLGNGVNIVLADIRYFNEAEWVRNHGGTVIFINRDALSRGYVANEQHPCERGLPDELAHFIVENNGTIKQLFQSIDWIFNTVYHPINIGKPPQAINLNLRDNR